MFGAAIAALLLASPTALLAQDTVRITLPEAIAQAASRNIDLLRAENALRSAQARIKSARGAFQPNLSLSAGPNFRYQLGSQQAVTGETPDHATGSFSLGLSSSYTLYNGNADRATLAQAEQLARASDITINRTAQTTVLAVITSFYDVATQRELIGVEQENLTAEQQQLDRIRAFTDAGTRPISDLYSEQATVAAAEVRLLEAQRAFEGAKLNLVQLLRLDPLGRYDFPAPQPTTGDTLMADAATLVQQAVQSRPEIAAEQARIDAAKEAIRVAEAGKAPVVSLSGSLGSSTTTTDSRNGLGSQLFTQNPSASVGLSLALPIFDRDRTEAAVEAARIDYENELLTMASLRQQVAIDVQSARLDVQTAQAQLAAADRQLAAARQGLDVAQTRYQSGVSTFVELSQARAQYVAAEGQVVQARNTLDLRRQQLRSAAGAIEAPRVAPQLPAEE
jgi:outer membrane protein